MAQTIWKSLKRSERAHIGQFDCDVWPVGDGARYSVLGPDGRYVKGGKCASVDWAKQVSSGFALSLSQVQA